MRGHEPLIARRCKGWQPGHVFVHLGYDRLDGWRHWDERGSLPNVLIGDDETIGRLDLRFVAGLAVHVSGDDEDRVEALVAACRDAGAHLVVGAAGNGLLIANEEGTTWRR